MSQIKDGGWCRGGESEDFPELMLWIAHSLQLQLYVPAWLPRKNLGLEKGLVCSPGGLGVQDLPGLGQSPGRLKQSGRHSGWEGSEQ